jgi:hypothetical protein
LIDARTLVLGLLLSGATAAAQSPADIERCAGVAADAERLACYDKLFSHREAQAASATHKSTGAAAATAAGTAAAATAATKSETAAGTAAGTAAKSAPAPSTASSGKPADDFGLDGRTPKGAKDEDKPPEGPSEMAARVASVATQPGGAFVLTLDNGQVWEQQHADWHFSLKAGDEVIIKRGTFKSYRLQLKDNNRLTAVTRVR